MSLTQPATLQKSGMPLPSTGRMSPQAGNTSNKQTHKRRDLREAVDEVHIFLQTTFITDFIIHLYYFFFFLEDSLHTMETGHTKCSRSRGWSILIAIILVCQTLIRWSIGDWVAWLICTSVAVDPLCTKKRSLWLICGHFYFDLAFSFSLFMLFLSLFFFFGFISLSQTCRGKQRGIDMITNFVQNILCRVHKMCHLQFAWTLNLIYIY